MLESKTDYDPSGKCVRIVSPPTFQTCLLIFAIHRYLNNTYTAPLRPLTAGGVGTKGHAARVVVRDAPTIPGSLAPALVLQASPPPVSAVQETTPLLNETIGDDQSSHKLLRYCQCHPFWWIYIPAALLMILFGGIMSRK